MSARKTSPSSPPATARKQAAPHKGMRQPTPNAAVKTVAKKVTRKAVEMAVKTAVKETAVKAASTELLLALRLRATAARVAVLEALRRASRPLSHADVEAALPQALDRVTLYRTLDTFVEVGLAARTVGPDRIGRFAFADASVDHHDHAHFLCDDCGRSVCLPTPVPPPVALPAGFALTSTDLNFHGHCADCQTQAKGSRR